MMNTRVLPTRNIPDPNEVVQSPEAESKLLEFAEKQIEKMSKHAKLGNTEGQVGFFELQQALASYQQVNLGLISVYALAKVEYARAKEQWEEWYSERYIEVRDELNPRSMTSTKWYGAKEIDMQVRVKYKVQYKKYSSEVTMAESKLSLLRRMMDSWATHNYTLSNLSKNAQAEVMGSQVEGY